MYNIHERKIKNVPPLTCLQITVVRDEFHRNEMWHFTYRAVKGEIFCNRKLGFFAIESLESGHSQHMNALMLCGVSEPWKVFNYGKKSF